MTSSAENLFEKGLEQYLSAEQLEKIRAVKIGIAGAGGLGSNCANYLVRTGFVNLKLVDFDRVEPSNLNRQFFFTDQVGRWKVEALTSNLLRINPACSIETETVRVTAHTAISTFEGYDIIVEAFDNASAKAMLISTLVPAGKYVVSASGLAGYGHSDAIRIQQHGRNLVIIGDQESGVSPNCPPLAPRVNVAAAKQADCVLEYVLELLDIKK